MMDMIKTYATNNSPVMCKRQDDHFEASRIIVLWFGLGFPLKTLHILKTCYKTWIKLKEQIGSLLSPTDRNNLFKKRLFASNNYFT